MLALVNQKHILIVILSMFTMSCKTTNTSELAGGSRGPKPLPPIDYEVEPSDPNLCTSQRNRFEEFQFGIENTSATFDERVSCLSKAVKGIGTPTAQKIIEDELIITAPRSWETFVKQMNQLTEKHGLRDVYQNAVTIHGDNNKEMFNDMRSYGGGSIRQRNSVFSECVTTGASMTRSSRRNIAIRKCIDQYAGQIPSSQCKGAAARIDRSTKRDYALRKCADSERSSFEDCVSVSDAVTDYSQRDYAIRSCIDRFINRISPQSCRIAAGRIGNSSRKDYALAKCAEAR